MEFVRQEEVSQQSPVQDRVGAMLRKHYENVDQVALDYYTKGTTYLTHVNYPCTPLDDYDESFDEGTHEEWKQRKNAGIMAFAAEIAETCTLYQAETDSTVHWRVRLNAADGSTLDEHKFKVPKSDARSGSPRPVADNLLEALADSNALNAKIAADSHQRYTEVCGLLQNVYGTIDTVMAPVGQMVLTAASASKPSDAEFNFRLETAKAEAEERNANVVAMHDRAKNEQLHETLRHYGGLVPWNLVFSEMKSLLEAVLISRQGGAAEAETEPDSTHESEAREETVREAETDTNTTNDHAEEDVVDPGSSELCAGSRSLLRIIHGHEEAMRQTLSAEDWASFSALASQTSQVDFRALIDRFAAEFGSRSTFEQIAMVQKVGSALEDTDRITMLQGFLADNGLIPSS